MILPATDWQQRAGLDRLTAGLGTAMGEVRYVGGIVRDTLLGLTSADIDLATSHAPDETARRIARAGFRAVPTGIAHGTITAVLPDGPIEVTTLRRDVATDGRHATVAFTDDWQADAARRDFTINALSADPASGKVFDYFDGLADLEQGLVRFIGDPLARIAEDHLRILRFFRFHARFGKGPPDAAALAACAARANDLMALSRERIAQEALKLLGGSDPAPTIALMLDHAILRPVLPEIDPGDAARLARLVEREQGYGDDPLRRLAALLPADPSIAEEVGARLKLSNAQRRRLVLAVSMEPGMPAKALAHAIGIEGARDRILLGDDPDWRDDLASLIDWVPPRLLLKGGDLIAMGVTPGPAVAATLRRIERRWVAEDFPDAIRVRAIAIEEVGRP